MQIAILGKKEETKNYVRFVQSAGLQALVTLDPEEVRTSDALILPGGGDITPAFFGQKNHGSRNIDTELDIRQLQAFSAALQAHLPVLGICKGLQIINVALGGTILQDLPEAAALRHRYEDGDKYHSTVIQAGSWLYSLYGSGAVVNSAHHQALDKLGDGLAAVQHCPEDGCTEAISHSSLPVIGVQWHPERIEEKLSGTDGQKIVDYFTSLISG